jgi:hypothetical protein
MRRVLPYWWLVFLLSMGALIVPALFSQIEHPPVLRATQELRILEGALELFRQDRARYPTTEEGLQMLVANQIMRTIPRDPWGGGYVYRLSSPESPKVYSVGQNMTDENGAGDAVSTSSRHICDAYSHCARQLSGWGLLTVALASLLVGLARTYLAIRRYALRWFRRSVSP